MRSLTALDGFRSTVRRYPDEVAVVTLDGRAYTYRELDRRSTALADALDERLGDGRCAVVTENRVAAIESMLAALKRGRANVQLSNRAEVGELESMLGTGQGRGLVYDSSTAERAAKLADRVELDAVIGAGDGMDVGPPGAEAYEAVVAEGDPDRPPAPTPAEDDEAAVFYTSGTTGAPKAVIVDQEQYWLAAHQPALEMSLTASDRALLCTPWYHGVTTFTWIAAHLTVGATLVVQPSFEPGESLRALEDHDVTGLLAVPAQLESLLEAQEEVGADLDELSYIRTGGAVVPDTLIAEVRERFTEGVFNTYGQTEAVLDLSFAYPEEQDDHPGTIGKGTYLWELRVVEAVDPPERPDPDDPVAPGDTGEIIARCPRMIDGYLDDPEESEAIFVEGLASDASGTSEAGTAAGRWLRTGDVARVDDDGYLVVIDRIDNMLVSGGENVYPEEVQRALKDHPSVRDAAVVGLPDERWGHRIAAAVVASDDLTEAALDEHCKAHDTLADFKRPREYVLLPADEELPRTATGSLRRGELEELFAVGEEP